MTTRKVNENMKFLKRLILSSVLLLSFSAHANGIDDKCPQLTYKSAPVINADQYLCRKEYAVAYSYSTRNPIYTTEFLTKSHSGKEPRVDDFRPDKDIPEQYRATLSDYVHSQCNGGRCDRGHMTPNADFSSDSQAADESFLLSNMVPQNFQNNEIIWKNMETHIRDYVAKGHDVYVLTGPAYTNPVHTTIGSHKIAVPDMLWKVAIDSKTGQYMAFYMPNQNIPVHDLMSKQVSLDVIEKATGLKFDNHLDKHSVTQFPDW